MNGDIYATAIAVILGIYMMVSHRSIMWLGEMNRSLSRRVAELEADSEPWRERAVEEARR